MKHETRQAHTRWLRIFRQLHRQTGVLLFLFFFVVACTGLVLGWKKHSGGYILAKSYTGASDVAANWLPLDSLQRLAKDSVQVFFPGINPEIDRIDVRPDKGMAKFVFTEKYLALQLDLTTGQVLHVEKRRGDFFENLHDGSLLDRWFGISGGWIKLVYTTIMGLALIIFTVTGFWLWYGPKWIKRKR